MRSVHRRSGLFGVLGGGQGCSRVKLPGKPDIRRPRHRFGHGKVANSSIVRFQTGQLRTDERTAPSWLRPPALSELSLRRRIIAPLYTSVKAPVRCDRPCLRGYSGGVSGLGGLGGGRLLLAPRTEGSPHRASAACSCDESSIHHACVCHPAVGGSPGRLNPGRHGIPHAFVQLVFIHRVRLSAAGWRGVAACIRYEFDHGVGGRWTRWTGGLMDAVVAAGSDEFTVAASSRDRALI